MAEPQDRPDNTDDTAPEHMPGAGPTPPADAAPANPPGHAAGMAPPPTDRPDEPAKKAHARKAPAKAVKKSQPEPAKKAAAKKAAAKKVPAKKAAKKAPPKKAPANPPSQSPTPPHIETNGHLAAAAKDVAAQAKSTVDAASDPVSGLAGLPAAARSPVPFAVAIAVSLLALLLVRQLRQRGASGNG